MAHERIRSQTAYPVDPTTANDQFSAIIKPIGVLEAHPLASGDFYPGDLLKQVMEIDEAFWRDRAELRHRLMTALERAIERVGKTRTPLELEGELRASLKQHRAASSNAGRL